MTYYARSSSVVGEEMAKKYAEIQNYHNDFFVIAENSFLTTFIILTAHVFDKRDDSFSLRKINCELYEKFFKDNEEIIDEIIKARHKVFAHKAKKSEDLKIPSVEKIDKYFNNLQEFYNQISNKQDQSVTWFSYDNLKHNIESLYKNLYRGECARLGEIDVEYLWKYNENSISKKI